MTSMRESLHYTLIILILLLGTATFTPKCTYAGDDLAIVDPDETLAAKKTEKKGVDPTDFLIRLEVTNEYLNLPGGGHQNYTTPRGDYVIDGKALLRLDVPIAYADLSGRDSAFGLGDVRFRFGALLFRKPIAAAAIGADVFFDTATAQDLGLGKYVVGPVAVVSFYPADWLRIYPNIKYRTSVAGDSARPEVNYFQVDVPFEFSLPRNWWIEVEPRTIVDFEDNERLTLLIEFETGKLITKHIGLWVRPKFFVTGTKPYDFAVETGFRYLFD